MDINYLNREYSPSSCVDDVNIYIQQYVDLSRKAQVTADLKKTRHINLQYGMNTTQLLDIYMPEQPSQSSLMVYIHGGYWQELSKEESSFAATNFQKHGFHFAVIDYTLAPHARLTEIVHEVRQAIVWLYNNSSKYGYRPEDIYVCGSSAGGHLAMMMLQTDWSNYILGSQKSIIKGVCAVSGIYDIQPLLNTYINDKLNMDLVEAKSNSPLMLPLPQKKIPVIIAFGENETFEFKLQSKAMYEKLMKQGYRVQYKEIPERNHFDVILDLCDNSSWLFSKAKSLTTDCVA